MSQAGAAARMRSGFCSHKERGLLIHSFMDAFIHAFIHSFIHPFIHSCIHSFMHSFIHAFIHSFIHPFIHSSIHSFMHSFIHAFIHSFIHSWSVDCGYVSPAARATAQETPQIAVSYLLLFWGPTPKAAFASSL